jgi:hypothetical protein
MDSKRRRAGMGTLRSPAAVGTPQGIAKWKMQAGKLGKLSRNTVGSERTYIDVWKVRVSSASLGHQLAPAVLSVPAVAVHTCDD